MDLFGSAQSGLHVIADIFRANDLFEFGLMDQAGGLLARAAEKEVVAQCHRLQFYFYGCGSKTSIAACCFSFAAAAT